MSHGEQPPDPCPELDDARWATHLDDDRAGMGAALGAELEHKLLRRLASAWNDLNWQHLRGLMRPPSVQLHDGERRWGAWHPARRLITISRRQVLCYAWTSVVETLKHEMAHQFVSEHLHLDHEPPHGRAFRDACARLAVDPSPVGDGGVSLLRPGGAGRSADPNDSRLARIQKLLALADNNPDEHEARAAFARASELMLVYNLEPDARPRPDGYVHRVLGPCLTRIPHHRYVVAGLLQEHYFVQCIWIDGYDVRTGAKGHQLEVMGTPRNVEMAEYVHDCLLRQVEALWDQYRRERGVRDRSAKREYLDGVLAGFGRQLRQSAAASAERGLVWVGDQGLSRWARRRHPRTTTARVSSVAATDARREGVAQGERLRLHRPVAGGDGGGGRLLPG
jgi:hypothetical protein